MQHLVAAPSKGRWLGTVWESSEALFLWPNPLPEAMPDTLRSQDTRGSISLACVFDNCYHMVLLSQAFLLGEAWSGRRGKHSPMGLALDQPSPPWSYLEVCILVLPLNVRVPSGCWSPPTPTALVPGTWDNCLGGIKIQNGGSQAVPLHPNTLTSYGKHSSETTLK